MFPGSSFGWVLEIAGWPSCFMKVAALWRTVYGPSETERPHGNYSLREGNFVPVPDFYLVRDMT